MSTIEDFENAPVGATATNWDGSVRVWKETETGMYPWWAPFNYEWLSNGELVGRGYTLDPLAPTTAQEALDMAWELAHPVKEGQTIPEGVRLLDRLDRNDLSAYTTRVDFTVTARESLHIRTLDPLPDPEPDWLDAPAVLAVCNDSLDRAVFVRENKAGTRWVRDTRFYRWDDLRDVTPLYPKEDA